MYPDFMFVLWPAAVISAPSAGFLYRLYFASKCSKLTVLFKFLRSMYNIYFMFTTLFAKDVCRPIYSRLNTLTGRVLSIYL